MQILRRRRSRQQERVHQRAVWHIQDARRRIDSANRWIPAFFFVLVVIWLNFAVDITAGGRGLPEHRIAEAATAATEALSSCKTSLAECDDKKIERLDAALASLNDDISLVVLPIRQLDIVYQPAFIIVIVFALLMYIAWSRRTVLNSVMMAIDVVGPAERGTPIPPDLIIASAPVWIWPLPKRGRSAAQLSAHFNVDAERRAPQLYVGLALFVSLCLMAAHAVWVHYRVSPRIIGSDFARLNLGKNWEKLERFKGELPHSMAFTGQAWLDLLVLIGGFAGAYFIIDYVFGTSRLMSTSRLRRDETPALSNHSRRVFLATSFRTIAVATTVASFVVLSNLSQSPFVGILTNVNYRNNPRYRRQRKLLAISKAEAVYLNKTRSDTSIAHFVRGNSDENTAKGVYQIRVDHLSICDLSINPIDDARLRVDRSARSEAIEWTALRILDRYGPAAMLKFINPPLLLEIIRPYRPGRLNFRLFDLAAAVSVLSGDRASLDSLVRMMDPATGFYSTEVTDKMEHRRTAWSDPSSKWNRRWMTEKPPRWDGSILAV